jgi:CheY-like chemotaxis protein
MPPVKKKRILIAEDHPREISDLKDALEADGFEVLTAMDGKEAIKLAAEHVPDLIILDVFMPQMSGGLVRLSLKEECATREIPVIFLSHLFAEKEIAGQDIMFGDGPRFGKPCDLKKLLRTVQTLIAGPR